MKEKVVVAKFTSDLFDVLVISCNIFCVPFVCFVDGHSEMNYQRCKVYLSNRMDGKHKTISGTFMSMKLFGSCTVAVLHFNWGVIFWHPLKCRASRDRPSILLVFTIMEFRLTNYFPASGSTGIIRFTG
jgi:hypothetical protein